jgi:hypothetical protein
MAILPFTAAAIDPVSAEPTDEADAALQLAWPLRSALALEAPASADGASSRLTPPRDDSVPLVSLSRSDEPHCASSPPPASEIDFGWVFADDEGAAGKGNGPRASQQLVQELAGEMPSFLWRPPTAFDLAQRDEESPLIDGARLSAWNVARGWANLDPRPGSAWRWDGDLIAIEPTLKPRKPTRSAFANDRTATT